MAGHQVAAIGLSRGGGRTSHLAAAGPRIANTQTGTSSGQTQTLSLLSGADDPVAPAKRSSAAFEKVHTHITEEGTPAQSLRTLIAELATLVRNTCRTPGDLAHPATFDILTTPTTLQRRAFELLDKITV